MGISKFEVLTKNRPHVVILGAGASCAAIPNGDRNGGKISAMNGFIDKLGFRPIINKVSLRTKSDNLEDIYMELYERKNSESICKEIIDELEKEITQYMSSFRIPAHPTVYDFLILSLTSKDLIATFNWDPLLAQAFQRCRKLTSNLPHVCFLHGNVAMGFCEQDSYMGIYGTRCSRCGQRLRPIRLLFPIKDKNYDNDVVITKSWRELTKNLSIAYMVTIFGYSAPKSDISAIQMMQRAWGKSASRELEEIEIIDICKEEDLLEKWKDFICESHYSPHSDFFSSTLAKAPRRSCEFTFDRTMNVLWPKVDSGFKPEMDFQEVKKYITPLLEDEKSNKILLANPYMQNNN